MIEAYHDKNDFDLNKMALHASWIINTQRKKGSKPITPRMLLGKDKPMTKESKEEEFKKLIDLMDERKRTTS